MIEIFEKQLQEFVYKSKDLRPEFKNYYRYPILNESTANTKFDTHYIYHVAWAIRKILSSVLEGSCSHHLDISSSLNFCTAISSFIPTTFIDYRPASISLSNLICKEGDLTKDNNWLVQYESVSCMHVIEHIGLGRYGDIVDINSDLVAMNNLMRIVKPGGTLLFVVPTGIPEIYFNAHRVYSAKWIIEYFSDQFDLKEFYYIFTDSDKPPVINFDISLTENITYGCGCYEFIKR